MADETRDEVGTAATPATAAAGPSPFEAVTDPLKYRVPDATYAPCAHGFCGTLCATSGKTGRNGRSAAIGATLFWLTCPQLNNIIARFERHGVIAALSQRLQDDRALLDAHVASHQAYEALALSLLPEHQAAFFQEHFIANASRRKFGNAGVGHAGDLKCLHALVAQTLCGASNPLGNLCLHYILHLQSVVQQVVEQRADPPQDDGGGDAPSSSCPTQGPDDTAPVAVVDKEICGLVDTIASMVACLDRMGLAACGTPPLVRNREDGGTWAVAGAECCRAAEYILVACEGHAARARKKHRKN